MLINRKAVKVRTLEIAGERHHKFTRVSPEFLAHVDSQVDGFIREYVKQLPSTGKTIK